MLKVVTLVQHALDNSSDDYALLLPVNASLLLRTESSLLFSQLLERLLKMSRVLDIVTVAVDGVMLETDVDADSRIDGGRF